MKQHSEKAGDTDATASSPDGGCLVGGVSLVNGVAMTVGRISVRSGFFPVPCRRSGRTPGAMVKKGGVICNV